ncbi:MAG: hypothetical protein ACE5GJ_12730 [Gemmatimonadota bacterium]
MDGGILMSTGRFGVGAGKSGSKESREVLHAKYLDYCSSQVADLLLYLSPDEIFLLAQRAHREAGGEGELTYAEMVKIATDWLSARIKLPPFEMWADDYREHPERYDHYLLGFWEDEVDGRAG